MISYRTASIADLDYLLKIEKKCFSLMDCFSKKSFKRAIINPNHSMITHIILSDDQRIGYAIFLMRKQSTIIRLYSICIDPHFSGKGIGKNYLRLQMDAFKNNFSFISLEVRETNAYAIRLYKSLGFQLKKILPAYYPDQEAGLQLIKRLES